MYCLTVSMAWKHENRERFCARPIYPKWIDRRKRGRERDRGRERRSIGSWVSRWLNECMDGWVDGWMDR